MFQAAQGVKSAIEPDERRAAFAELRALLGDKLGAGIEADRFLERIRIAYAANFSLNAKTDHGRFDFDPVLFSRHMGETSEGDLVDESEASLLTQQDNAHFQLRFRSQEGGRRSYLLSDGTLLFLDPLLGKALDVVRKKQAGSSQEKREFLRSSEPTIASMLVVLDSMHARLADVDAEAALARLTDRFRPAIEFHVLDLKDMKLDNDIYVRMNSRGKPLTDFEIFKARFGKKLEMHFPDRAREFAQRIDGVWLDAFWSALATPDGQPIIACAIWIAIAYQLSRSQAGIDLIGAELLLLFIMIPIGALLAHRAASARTLLLASLKPGSRVSWFLSGNLLRPLLAALVALLGGALLALQLLLPNARTELFITLTGQAVLTVIMLPLTLAFFRDRFQPWSQIYVVHGLVVFVTGSRRSN